MWSKKRLFCGKKKGEEEEKIWENWQDKALDQKPNNIELRLGKGKQILYILFLQGVYKPLLFLLETVEQQRICEQISTPKEVLLSKNSCPAGCFLCWRRKWHGDLYLPRWMHNTSREKHTRQSIKREIEDLYKLYFKIFWGKKVCFKNTDTLNSLVTLVI